MSTVSAIVVTAVPNRGRPIAIDRMRARVGVTAALAAGLWLAVVDPALAQSGAGDAAALQKRIEFLERQVRYLSNQLVGGAGSGSGGRSTLEPPPATDAGPSGESAAARLTVRLDQLERDLRATTGRLEEIGFRVEQIDKKMDQLAADVEFQLGAASTTPKPGGAAPTEPVAPARSSPPEPSSRAAGGTAGPGSGPRVLGTLTPEEFERNRPPPPEPRADPPSETPPTVAASTPRQQYAAGFDLLQKGRPAEARAAFETFLSRYPNDPLAANARYWLGETYYKEGNFAQAATAFLDGYEKDKTSSKSPETLLMLGLSLSRLDKKREACATFGELDRAFPNAPDTVKEPAAKEKKRLGCG